MGNFHPSKCYFLYVCLKSSIQQWSYSIFVGVKRSVKSTPESKGNAQSRIPIYVGSLIGERVVQRRYIQCIWSGYRIPKQAHLSVFLESEPHSLAQKQTSFWSNQERDVETSEDFAWPIFWALGHQYFNHSFKFWENDWNQLLHHFWWSMAIMHYFCLCLMFNLWEA